MTTTKTQRVSFPAIVLSVYIVLMTLMLSGEVFLIQSHSYSTSEFQINEQSVAIIWGKSEVVVSPLDKNEPQLVYHIPNDGTMILRPFDHGNFVWIKVYSYQKSGGSLVIPADPKTIKTQLCGDPIGFHFTASKMQWQGIEQLKVAC